MTDTNDSSAIPNGVIDPEQDNTLRALAATSGYLNWAQSQNQIRLKCTPLVWNGNGETSELLKGQ